MESTFYGLKRARELDKHDGWAQVWVASTDIEDLMLGDTEFIPAGSMEEGADWLKAKYPPPDPNLYRVVACRPGTGCWTHGYADQPARVIVLRTWYWSHGVHSGNLPELAELAAAFGPIGVWRKNVRGYRDGPDGVIRAVEGYSSLSIVVRNWLEHHDDKMPDPVVVYEPKSASRREKGLATRARREAAEARNRDQERALIRRANEFTGAVNRHVQDRLRRDFLGSPRLLPVAPRLGLNLSVSTNHAYNAADVYKAVFRTAGYRDLPEFVSLLNWWRDWPEDVTKADVNPQLAEFLAREVKLSKRPRAAKAAPQAEAEDEEAA